MAFSLESVQKKNTSKKKTTTNDNTLRSIKNSLDNFESFCIEEYNGSSDEIIRQASKHGKDGILALLQAWIYWNHDRKLLPRSIMSMATPIKKKLNKFGIALSPLDFKELDFGKIQKEQRGIMTNEMLEHFINHCDKMRKCLYLLQSCSAMRIGEIIALKRKHLDTTKDRIQINLSASMTKAKEARITFVSKECERLLNPIIENLEPNDLIFNTARSTEEHAFRRISKLAGFTEKYESSRCKKVNTHAIRAYAITRMNKLNEFGFGHVIAGHGFYMKTYNRRTPDELLEDYVKAEPYLQIFNRDDPQIQKDMGELREQNKELRADLNAVIEHMKWDTMAPARLRNSRPAEELGKN